MLRISILFVYPHHQWLAGLTVQHTSPIMDYLYYFYHLHSPSRTPVWNLYKGINPCNNNHPLHAAGHAATSWCVLHTLAVFNNIVWICNRNNSTRCCSTVLISRVKYTCTLLLNGVTHRQIDYENFTHQRAMCPCLWYGRCPSMMINNNVYFTPASHEMPSLLVSPISTSTCMYWVSKEQEYSPTVPLVLGEGTAIITYGKCFRDFVEKFMSGLLNKMNYCDDSRIYSACNIMKWVYETPVSPLLTF